MFGVPHNTYYQWENRDINGYRTESEIRRAKENTRICREIHEIVNELSYVPGSRVLAMMIRQRNPDLQNVGRNRVRALMKHMHIKAFRPLRDAYKHQAVHDHPLTAPDNLVQQDFFQGVRRVILTDITYLYYSMYRTPFYVCMFKDAFTTEILGRECSRRMDVNLVQQAYNDMMDKHKDEFKKGKGEPKVFIHSDQGSQYLSTTFKKLLHDDGFIQSVSARGNSQDNSPMESHFAQMKTELLQAVAMAASFEQAATMVMNHTNQFNTVVPRTCIAGLTPAAFYQYCTTGIYPFATYYGVPAEKMHSAQELIEWRKQNAEELAEKRRKQYAESHKRMEALKTDPAKVFELDRKRVKREINGCNLEMAELKELLEKYTMIMEKIDLAEKYYNALPPEEREKFKEKAAWQSTPEMGYIYDMDNMF